MHAAFRFTCAVLFALPLIAAPKPLRVPLTFTPQEGTSATSVTLDPAASEIPLSVVFREARSGNSLLLGEGTNDDDESFDIVALTDPLAFVRASAGLVFTTWRVPVKDGAERSLDLELRQFRADESNKAVGSTYAATVALRYVLRRGQNVLVAGDASGSSQRYGRKRSVANCSEVLSDALKDALASILDDATVQQAWITGAAPTPPAERPASASIEERLNKLKDLYDRGVITKEEYESRRAEMLKEM